MYPKYIRQAWLNYYNNLGFTTIPSAPLVHPAFPLSFNMSAGLIQLDPQIRSKTKTPPSKQCLIQKCFRYFDLDKIDDDSHLSFFEMAGAFEIAQFDESKTIENLWNFVVNVLEINPDKIWITIFTKDQVADKTIETSKGLYETCLNLVGKNRLIKGKSETNLWKQGGGAIINNNLRLCGPQVEFFYDLGKNYDKERLLEFSNTIFIKYGIDTNQEPTLIELQNPASESVIGLERIAWITEKTKDIYQISNIKPILNVVTDQFPITTNKNETKIIVDHIRALTFILSEEKIMPGSNGRKKIVRVLIRQLLTSMLILKLDVKKLIPQLINEVIKIYSTNYPEIAKSKSETADFILDYYQKVFHVSLEKGKRRINAYLVKNKIETITPEIRDKFKIDFGVPEKLQPK
jgi:alanyl-tRNA synthetase